MKAAMREILKPVLGDMLDANNPFSARLPALADIRGIGGRTHVDGDSASAEAS